MGGSYDGDAEEEESRRPREKAFYQQKLPAWEPVMTANWGAGTFLVMAVIALPFGIALLVASEGLQEVVVHYGAECETPSGVLCEDYFKDADNIGSVCNCTVGFEVNEDIKGDIFMYYSINNFYQNERFHQKSRDYYQLIGKFRDPGRRKPENRIEKDCEPIRFFPNGSFDGIPFAPCGMIANSLFNDSMSLFYDDGAEDVPLLRTGIAWDVDKNSLYKNPPGDTLVEAFNGTEKPPYWSKQPWQLDELDEDNNGYQNEDFMVWMRTSPFPNFRKLYRRMERIGSFQDGLPAGRYILQVDYAYPTHKHEGDKTIVLANMSWAGGKNNFLGILYIVTSVLCFVLAALFFVIHIYTKDWDKILEAESRKTMLGIDNPMMAGTNVKDDEPVTPQTWRRRVSMKPIIPEGSTSSSDMGRQCAVHNMDIAGNSDQGLEILNRLIRDPASNNSDKGNGMPTAAATETTSLWM